MIQRRAAIRNEKRRRRKNNSYIDKDLNTTEFKQFVLNEMIKIVVRMNSMRFKTVYWLTIDKYYHLAVWMILEIKRC